MSGRDKYPSLRLPFDIIFVLVVCACSLAVHFVAESATPLSSPAVFELAGAGGHFHAELDHTEDNFILSSRINFLAVPLLISIVLSSELFFFLPTVQPQLSPPKYFAPHSCP